MISVRHYQDEYRRKASYQGSGIVSPNLQDCEIDWLSMSFSSPDYAREMAELLKSAATLAEEWNMDAGKPASAVLGGKGSDVP